MRISVPAPGQSLYDRVGGREFFDRMVERFYEGVADDPVLRPMYPDDLSGPIENTAGFLAQLWGGGTVQYSDHRGHPRLRARHMPFAIGRRERDAWLHHMTEAVRGSGAGPDEQREMLEYFDMAATHMINQP